jgi:hypothetical protein
MVRFPQTEQKCYRLLMLCGTLDPLDNEDALMENLDMLANIARCKYQEAASTVITIFEPIAASYEVSTIT